MGYNFEHLSEDEFLDYRIAYDVIKSLEQSGKAEGIAPSLINVRNYLANIIAQYTLNNL